MPVAHDLACDLLQHDDPTSPTRAINRQLIIMKVARKKSVTVPEGVCLSCFNEQQQFNFPFLVYCPHNAKLALVRAPEEHATFECAPDQLEHVLKKLEATENVKLAPRAQAARPKRRRA